MLLGASQEPADRAWRAKVLLFVCYIVDRVIDSVEYLQLLRHNGTTVNLSNSACGDSYLGRSYLAEVLYARCSGLACQNRTIRGNLEKVEPGLFGV